MGGDYNESVIKYKHVFILTAANIHNTYKKSRMYGGGVQQP